MFVKLYVARNFGLDPIEEEIEKRHLKKAAKSADNPEKKRRYDKNPDPRSDQILFKPDENSYEINTHVAEGPRY